MHFTICGAPWQTAADPDTAVLMHAALPVHMTALTLCCNMCIGQRVKVLSYA